MKINCKGCGAENELGRVFCASCGARLDLSRASMEDIRGAAGAGRDWHYGKFVFFVVVAAIVAAIAMALWPRAVVPAESPASAARFKDKMMGLQQITTVGKSGSAAFEVGEINAYLGAKAREIDLDSLGVVLSPGQLRLRAVGLAGPLRIGPLSLGTVRFSYDLVAGPAGKDWGIGSVAMGHLPLVGPARQAVLRRLEDRLDKCVPEKQLLAKIKEIKVEEGKVEIAVEK